MPITKKVVTAQGIVFWYHKILAINFDRTAKVTTVVVGSWLNEEFAQKYSAITLLPDIIFQEWKVIGKEETQLDWNAVDEEFAKWVEEWKRKEEEKDIVTQDIANSMRVTNFVVDRDLDFVYDEEKTIDQNLAIIYWKIEWFSDFEE